MVLDSFKEVQRVEWDTLLFFFGIIFAVGGLGCWAISPLRFRAFYTDLGADPGQCDHRRAVGDDRQYPADVCRADDGPGDVGRAMVADHADGGRRGARCCLIGSAAGGGADGQAKGVYTFSAHLKWAWAIALGYVAAIAAHLLINAAWF
jgi:hypothetical protein